MGEGIESSQREQRFALRIRRSWVRSLYFFAPLRAITDSRKEDVHTIITPTDNAPQGLNDSLSSLPLATTVVPSFTPFPAV